jgi:hypothetical protein
MISQPLEELKSIAMWLGLKRSFEINAFDTLHLALSRRILLPQVSLFPHTIRDIVVTDYTERKDMLIFTNFLPTEFADFHFPDSTNWFVIFSYQFVNITNLLPITTKLLPSFLKVCIIYKSCIEINQPFVGWKSTY